MAICYESWWLHSVLLQEFERHLVILHPSQVRRDPPESSNLHFIIKWPTQGSNPWPYYYQLYTLPADLIPEGFWFPHCAAVLSSRMKRTTSFCLLKQFGASLGLVCWDPSSLVAWGLRVNGLGVNPALFCFGNCWKEITRDTSFCKIFPSARKIQKQGISCAHH